VPGATARPKETPSGRVAPQPGEIAERLLFTFDEVTDSAAALTLDGRSCTCRSIESTASRP